jgi:hypothetical protein
MAPDNFKCNSLKKWSRADDEQDTPIVKAAVVVLGIGGRYPHAVEQAA